MKNFKNAPYIRMWLHCFDYQSTIKRKEYFIDLVLHIIFTSLLCLVTLLFEDNHYLLIYLYCGIVAIQFILPYLSLTARRIKDTGASPYLCFISLAAMYGIISNLIVCLFKSKEDQKNKSKKKYFFAYFFPALAVVIFIFMFILHMIVTTLLGVFNELDTDITNYETKKEELTNASLFLPSLSDFEESDVTIQYGYKRTELVFVSETISLHVTYQTKEEFDEQVDTDLSRYVFHDTVVTDSTGDYIIPLTSFDYNGFTYQFVLRNKETSEEDYEEYLEYIFDNRYCKSYMLYAINEETYTISYLYFYDYDLDYISYKVSTEKTRENDMIDYLKDYFYLVD